MTSTDFSSLPPEPPLARFALPFFALTLGGLFLAGRYSMAPGALTAVTAILGLGYLPGLAITLLVERRFGLWAGWVLPLLISPVLVAGICLILGYWGVPVLDTCSWVVLGSVTVICLIPPPKRELEDRAVTINTPEFLHRRSDRDQVLFVAGGVLVVLTFMFLSHPHILDAPDAVFQIALAERAIDSLPPLDPLLSGLPYRGAWAWPLYLGCLSQAARLDVSVILVMSSLVAAFTLVFAAYRCLGALGLDHTRSLWGTVFLFLALAPPIWPWSGGQDPDAFFLGTFLTPGSHLMGWMYGLLIFWGAVSFLRGTWRGSFWVGVGFTGLWLFNPSLSVFLCLLFLFSLPVAWVVCRLAPWKAEGLRVLGLGLLGPLGFGLCWVYLRSSSVMGDVPLASYVDLSQRHILGVFSQLHWLGLAGVVGYFAFLASHHMRYQVWAIWGVTGLFLSCLCFGPPGVEYAHHLLLSLTAGSWVPWVWNKRPKLKPLVFAALLILLIPSTVLALVNFSKTTEKPERSALVRWIHAKTPKDAVFIVIDPYDVLRAGRETFFNQDYVVRREHRASVVSHRSLVQFAVVSGKPLEFAQAKTVEELASPVYWLDRDAVAPAPLPWVLQTSFGDVAIYRWDPSSP